MSPVYTSGNVPKGGDPRIASFTATPNSLSSGQSATLNWNVSGASYLIVAPGIAAVRGSSTSVRPTATTTFTLYATGPFGRSQQTVTVTVH